MKLKLTRERIILCGLLLAAGGGFAADQFVFADAGDAAGNDAALPAAIAGASKPARVLPMTPEQTLAARLQQLAGTPPSSPDGLRNLFAAGDPVVVANAPRPNAWAKRVLNGVLFGADGKGVAIIDGRMVPVGSRMDGMQLVRVTKVMAVFSNGTEEITLKINQKLSPPN